MADFGFTGTLTIGANKYDVITFDIAYNRRYDGKGRPSSAVSASEMNFTIEITDMVTLVEAMINVQNKPIEEGTVEFWQAGITGVFRKLTFNNAFITSYSESFYGTDSSNFACTISISAEKITLGTAVYDAAWPVTS